MCRKEYNILAFFLNKYFNERFLANPRGTFCFFKNQSLILLHTWIIYTLYCSRIGPRYPEVKPNNMIDGFSLSGSKLSIQAHLNELSFIWLSYLEPVSRKKTRIINFINVPAVQHHGFSEGPDHKSFPDFSTSPNLKSNQNL